VILASNFPKNIDEAFRRRMHFSVDFAVPERDLREEIWTHIFPDKTPLGDDIDFTFLSGFKISGGNIKNIALNAAFLAAADSGEVTMKCLVKATRREFQKIGRLYVKEEFGPYYHFIEGDA
jgi:SpoVK/Ycf46/Vps4 family AAA+-type ATPase